MLFLFRLSVKKRTASGCPDGKPMEDRDGEGTGPAHSKIPPLACANGSKWRQSDLMIGVN